MMHAFRSITSYPITALVAVLSLAAGIGATTVTLTIRNVIFHNPPPLYQQPAQLSKIQTARADRPILPAGSGVPGALYLTWRDTLPLSIAAATPARGVKDVRTGDRMDTVPVRAVTPEFFTILGINAEAGQLFTASARQTTDVVLSHRLWQRLFDGRPDVAGRELWIEGHPYTVIGVAPERFWFGEMSSPIWTLLDDRAIAAEDALSVVVRRPDGMTHDVLALRLQNGLVDYASHLPAA